MRASFNQWAHAVKAKSWVWPDTYAPGNINHLAGLLTQITGLAPPPGGPRYGHHFLYNTAANLDVGQDGYDNYQAPLAEDGSQLFQRRMWVGGSLTYALPPAVNDSVSCTEKIQSTRLLGSNAFVQIARHFTRENADLLHETRTLLYTNDPFSEGEPRPGRLPATALKTLELKFSSLQLAKFCALTYNLHKIHHDLAYCRSENFANIVVSGPIMVLTMLHSFSSLFPEIAIREFKYKNSDACYIDDAVSLGVWRDQDKYRIELSSRDRLICGGDLTPE